MGATGFQTITNYEIFKLHYHCEVRILTVPIHAQQGSLQAYIIGDTKNNPFKGFETV